MHKGPGRFELTLNLQEVVVLFFVMVALFTGLLFFGYRVGYTQSTNAMQLRPGPVEPVQEGPKVEQQAPAVEAEPELRLENSPLKPGDVPADPAGRHNPTSSDRKPLAKQFGEHTQHRG
jgi:hypothetical protein